MENGRVNREYLSEELHRLVEDAGYRPSGWSAPEISDFRVLVQCARAAQVAADLRNMRMLRIEPDDTGDPNGSRATLSSGRVIELTFKDSDGHGAVAFELLTPEMEPQR